MIKNNVYYEFFASYMVPNSNEVGYWIDLGANSKGKIIKVYNQDIKSWVKLTDATSEDAVAPFIGSNGNWWVDNRDTGIPAAGKNPYIDKDTFTWWVYDSINSKYIDTGVIPEGKSAYILAVKHGFKGTEEEWLASLKKPAEDAAATALDAANKANEAADRANEAADEAEDAADRANTIANNPPKIVDNVWYVYNETTQEYESTGILATSDPLHIAKTYPSIADMTADFDNTEVKPGQFVMIDSDTEDPDNAKLYIKGDTEWIFVSDLSGAQGIQGLSAYQVAVQNGFKDTEKEWLQSLKQPALDAAEEALDAKAEVLATEADVKAAEALRVTAENSRVTAENTRTTNEQDRSTAESARVTAEESRVSAELSRVEAEKARVNNETGRAQNESERVKNELARQNNEIAREDKEEERESNEAVRKSSEDTRVSQENNREDAEDARVLAESARATAEQGRITTETTRESQEATRQANEAIRETQETARQTNTANAITAVNEAKTAAETATTNATTAANSANTQAARAKEYADNPPKIVTNYWYVWDDATDTYVNTNVNATGDPGKTPIIQSGTWWIYDNETDTYVNTNISVSPQYELTKDKVEAVLTGDITTHTHDTMYIGDAPIDTKQYVRQDGNWVEIGDIDLSNYLAKDNVNSYTPTSDYNPATKKYVDDTVASVDVTDQISGKADTTYVNDQLDTKVDKVTGKQLSTNDYTTTDKNKLAGIEEGAEVNVNADWNATSGDAQILNKPTIITEAEVDQKISTAVGAVYKVKGSVANYAALPTENVSIGDVYNLEDTGANYVATSTTPDWDKLSETVDLNGYLTKTDAASTYQPKGNYLTSVPEEYVTETELTAKGYATTTQVNTKLDSSAYTATDVLSKVKTVDGVGSGLDADLLDGKQGNEYALKTEVITEAPSDGKTYGRKNKQWSEIIASNQYLDLTTSFSGESGTLSDEDYQKIVDAWENSISLVRLGDMYGPMFIEKGQNNYILRINVLMQVATGVSMSSMYVEIDTTDKTYVTNLKHINYTNTGSGTKYLSDNGQYLTPPTATPTTAGYMSAEDKKKLDDIVNFGTGSNTVTTLVNIPTNKRLVKATLSFASNLSINESARALNVGEEIYLDCNPTDSFTQPIPTTGSFRSMSGSSITTTSGVSFEMSILKIATSGVMYSITVKEKD